MDIFQIVGLGFVVTMLGLIIKKEHPEIAVQLSLALVVIIFLFILDKISSVLEIFRELASRANINMLYLYTLLKIIAIAYVTEFGAQICRDAGEGAVAGKIEFAGKVIVMVMAVPIIALVLDTMVKLIP